MWGHWCDVCGDDSIPEAVLEPSLSKQVGFVCVCVFGGGGVETCLCTCVAAWCDVCGDDGVCELCWSRLSPNRWVCVCVCVWVFGGGSRVGLCTCVGRLV